MDSKRYFFYGFFLLGIIYFLSLPGEVKEPLNINQTVELIRTPSSSTLKNRNQIFKPVYKLRVKKPLRIQLDKKNPDSFNISKSCAGLSEAYGNAFYEKNKDEINKIVGGWYFGQSEELKALSSMSDIEKFFFAIAKAGLLIGAPLIKKDVNAAKEVFKDLHESNIENSAFLLPLYYLEEEEDSKNEYLRSIYQTKVYKNPAEIIYRKVYSLVESGEDFLGARDLLTKTPAINFSKMIKLLVEKHLYFIAMQIAENSLDEKRNIKAEIFKLDYSAAKTVMDKIYSDNTYEQAAKLIRKYNESERELNEVIKEMGDDCSVDIIWSLVHDHIKQNFQ